MMSMVGVVIAQLFALNQHDSGFGFGFGFAKVGRPLATVCFGFSILALLLGTCRAWRHQNAMIQGKALISGFEIHLLGIGTILVCEPLA